MLFSSRCAASAAQSVIHRPDYTFESHLQSQGFHFIAGVDEVGRGPLAGPVVAAAVILDPTYLPHGLDDSKKLQPRQREALYADILSCALAVSFASVGAISIDQSNIRVATLQAMARCVEALCLVPDYVLVDGRDVPPSLPCEAEAVVKGDQRVLSIAAASIVAKVARDRMMKAVGALHPDYGFEQHVGYATLAHRKAITTLGPLKGIHRYSFAPLKAYDQGLDMKGNYVDKTA